MDSTSPLEYVTLPNGVQTNFAGSYNKGLQRQEKTGFRKVLIITYLLRLRETATFVAPRDRRCYSATTSSKSQRKPKNNLLKGL